MSLFEPPLQTEETYEPSDLERALDLYERIASGGDDEFMRFTVIPGPPPSKARPRFRRSTGTTYTLAKDREAENTTACHLIRLVDPGPLTGNVALGCVFFRPDRQRIDTDNMLKHVCDAANGVLWFDDSQVTALIGITEIDPDNPRTIVVLGNHISTLGRGTDDVTPCKVCGAPITATRNGGRRKTCSKECAMRSRGAHVLTDLVPCAQCGKPFKRVNHRQRFCSGPCSRDALRDKRRAEAGPLSRCLDCDKELTHRHGGRCRDCWRTHTGEGPS